VKSAQRSQQKPGIAWGGRKRKRIRRLERNRICGNKNLRHNKDGKEEEVKEYEKDESSETKKRSHFASFYLIVVSTSDKGVNAGLELTWGVGLEGGRGSCLEKSRGSKSKGKSSMSRFSPGHLPAWGRRGRNSREMCCGVNVGGVGRLYKGRVD